MGREGCPAVWRMPGYGAVHRHRTHGDAMMHESKQDIRIITIMVSCAIVCMLCAPCGCRT